MITYLSALKHPSRPNPLRLAQSGFTLIELIFVMVISGIMMIYVNQELANTAKANIASGGGVYLKTVADALQRHVLLNFTALSAAVPVVAGTANALAPTMPEMIALTRLPAGYPMVMPTKQVVRLDITRAGCPGVACQLTSTVCTTTALTLGEANPRYDLVTVMYDAQAGSGGMARYGDGANIRGPALNFPNPNGNVPGVVCGSSVVDTALFNSFVRINDTRDPALLGPLTVAGATTLNGATAINNTLAVTGASTLGGATTVNNTLAVTGATTLGGAVAVTGAATLNNNLTVAGTSTLNGATTVNNTLAVTGAATMGSNLTVTGFASADRFTPTGAYAIGAACTTNGSIAQVSGASGLVYCVGGSWRAMAITAVAGDLCATEGMMVDSALGPKLICVNGKYQAMNTLIRAGTPGAGCTVAGAMGYDTTNNNESLICRANLAGGGFKWIPLRDVTTHFILVSGNVVHNNDIITKPFCADSAANPSTAIIHLLAKYTSTADGGTAVYAVDNGATWSIRLKTGAGGELTGAVTADNPSGLGTAVAQVYCYFP